MNLTRQLLKLNYPISQNLQLMKKLSGSQQEKSQQSQYVTVYKFKHIRLFSLINKTKLYHSILTGISIPTCEILFTLGQIDYEIVYITAIIGFAGCGALYSIGHFTKMFIGFLYYNEEKDMAKIAYADYWGRRKDIEVPRKDLMPLSELPKSSTDVVYYTIRRYSTKDTLKLSVKYAEVLNADKFQKLL